MKTLFIDIDGVLLQHCGSMSRQLMQPPALKGTIEKLDEWDRKGYKIILVTGRREGTRKQTEEHLTSLGIYYDQLIMGLPRGPRIIINDAKPDNDEQTAIGITLARNQGVKDLDL